ncbi:hypothetical protein RF11_12930 [Thelohanellus kitauei]|uniref:Uncharacterized protein n=1 Tax=Thelohanellus kitauei TaxID=669202 RepID=A0A0C2N615_THEKT|nr:hypothetical protein RF11_12930 [Thelohanellus kitauei]
MLCSIENVDACYVSHSLSKETLHSEYRDVFDKTRTKVFKPAQPGQIKCLLEDIVELCLKIVSSFGIRYIRAARPDPSKPIEPNRIPKCMDEYVKTDNFENIHRVKDSPTTTIKKYIISP